MRKFEIYRRKARINFKKHIDLQIYNIQDIIKKLLVLLKKRE